MAPRALHPRSGNTTNQTIAIKHTSAINDLMRVPTSFLMRVHQAATVVSRFDGSTTATSSNPSTTRTTSGTTKRTTAAVYQRDMAALG
jgi:hypothetical protein